MTDHEVPCETQKPLESIRQTDLTNLKKLRTHNDKLADQVIKKQRVNNKKLIEENEKLRSENHHLRTEMKQDRRKSDRMGRRPMPFIGPEMTEEFVGLEDLPEWSLEQELIHEQAKYSLGYTSSSLQNLYIDFVDRIAQTPFSIEMKQTLDMEARKMCDRLNRQDSAHRSFDEVCTYLMKLPLDKYNFPVGDLKETRERLNEALYGAQDLKEWGMRQLAILALAQKRKANFKAKANPLLLLGPPGTGKTFGVQAISSMMGRSCAQVSLGGRSDAVSLKGSDRLYSKSSPGKILSNLVHSQCMNPIVLLDELDKMDPNGSNGDPYDIILQITDKKQNEEFVDDYVDVPINLSRVLWVATANNVDSIPDPVRDRFVVVEFASYSLKEKMAIAKGWMIPALREDFSYMKEDEIILEDEAIEYLILNHCKEEGVRKLQMRLQRLMEKAIAEIAFGAKKIMIDMPLADKWLSETKELGTKEIGFKLAQVSL